MPTFWPAGVFSATLRVALVPSENTGALLGRAVVTVMVTPIVALVFVSLAATVTVYISPVVSVTPDIVRSWPFVELMLNDAASCPSRL